MRDDDDYEDERPRRRKEPHRGQTILVLGVVALALFHLIGPVVWWMGAVDLRKMRDGIMDRRGEGDTRMGYILGIISTVILAVSLLVATLVLFMFILGVGLFAAAAANAPR